MTFVKNNFLRVIIFLSLIVALFYFIQLQVNNNKNSQPIHQTSPNDKQKTVSYDEDIKPLLERRCIVCHGCYDAPCQLKLSSTEGILRGANDEKVYNSKRLKAIEPSRLFIDGKTENEWREKGFHSVLKRNESAGDKSLIQLLLELKKHNPQPGEGKLPADFTLDIEREQECPTGDDFERYADKHPLWGMPYAMPNLDEDENRLLTTWLDAGAATSKFDYSNDKATPQLSNWEDFLNQPSNKHRLTSRYLYEHLFHAHLHFDNTPSDEFYRLVRSLTPPGKAIDEIATTRPYDDPGDNAFYYRLLRYTPTIVAKNHIVYKLSDKRMQRYQQLFIEPEYDVKQLPSYQPEIASNPFKVYAAIPPDSRYRFLLDEARFFIEGFVKGPVCRGQVALNVIEDQFWIVFFNPDQDIFTTQAAFLDNMSDYLRIPSERGSHLNLLPIWTDYWKRQKEYMVSKQQYFEKMNTHDLHHAMNFIWDGKGVNPNAALTVLRHFDSASVEYGFVGEQPETAWVIDYPLFERIHYLLVAGFNVYGNVVHQLSTRIYMDFLRMEGEDHFLAFLPVDKRKSIRDSWYQGMRTELNTLFKAPIDWLNVESVTGYQTEDAQTELYQHIQQQLADTLRRDNNINHCGSYVCPEKTDEETRSLVENAMQKIASVQGEQLHYFPEVSFVRVATDDPEKYYIYSLIRNKAYKNVVSLLSDENKRNSADIDKDSLTVVDWLAGSYPNFFFDVNINDIDKFAAHCAAIDGQKSFDSFVERFGVRRTSPLFWKTADWFQLQYKKQRPIHSGLYDLSRYSNL